MEAGLHSNAHLQDFKTTVSVEKVDQAILVHIDIVGLRRTSVIEFGHVVGHFDRQERVRQIEDTEPACKPGCVNEGRVELFAKLVRPEANDSIARSQSPGSSTQGHARSVKSQAATGSMFSMSVTSITHRKP